MSQLDSTSRFSDRVDDHVRYRPDYPPALLEWLLREQGVDAGWLVDDVGAGTGISSKMFLDAGYRVTAAEPNPPMCAAAETRLASYRKFSALDVAADTTGLADASVDLVAVAQAFHWFGDGFQGSAGFEHAQRLDFEALRGRLMSSSYVPKQCHPRHQPMLHDLRELLDTCADDGTISFDYDTRIFAGNPA